MSAPESPDASRLREALASLDDASAPPADAGRIYEAQYGTMSAEERRAVVDELLESPEAAEAWRLAQDLAPETQERSAPTWSRLARWVPLAAAAILVLAIGWQIIPWRDEPGYRSANGRSLMSQLQADAPLPRAKPVLRWSNIEGARYSVRVLSAELELLEEASELTRPEYTLSTATLNRLPRGAPLLWQVEARVPGSPLLISPTFTVRLD
jgi:hypothetical protein